MTPTIIGENADALLTWRGLGDALISGHKLPKADIGDTFLYRGKDTLLSRSAFIDGMGVLVKSATVFPGNPAEGRPMVNGAVSLFSDAHGGLEALVDFHLVTKWKTAGDSLLGARMLARPESDKILIVGAGTVGGNLRAAYASLFPNAVFKVWNRTPENAVKFAQSHDRTDPVTDLQAAVEWADIVTSATMSSDPVIKGEWLRPGQHIDLIGAYRPDMREADDVALKRARIFVDSRDTTLDHIGELKTPIEAGVIAPDDVVADYYDIESGLFARTSDDDITLFKNGGGAHLDLMTARYIQHTWETAK